MTDAASTRAGDEDEGGVRVPGRTDERADTVAAMCRAGYASSMVLSHDASCYIDWFAPGLMEQVTPKWNYEHISKDVLPMLRERGVSDEAIHTMLVDNPRRYFEPPPAAGKPSAPKGTMP